MKTGQLCNRNPITVRKSDGVLTDRDIVVSVVARETDPRALRVGDVMRRSRVPVHRTERGRAQAGNRHGSRRS